MITTATAYSGFNPMLGNMTHQNQQKAGQCHLPFPVSTRLEHFLPPNFEKSSIRELDI